MEGAGQSLQHQSILERECWGRGDSDRKLPAISAVTRGALGMVSRDLGHRTEGIEGFPGLISILFPSRYMWLLHQTLAGLSRVRIFSLMLHD